MDFSSIIEKISSEVKFKQEEFDLFAKRVVQIKVKKNEIWEAEGKIGTYLGFVNKGILRQYIEKEDSQEVTEHFYTEGEFIGHYVSYLSKEPATTNIQALEDCELIAITFDDLQELYLQVPVIERFGRLTAERKLVEYHKRTQSLLISSPEERYHNLMLSKPNLHTRVKQYYIAQHLGIRPESLSRIRKRYADQQRKN